MQSDLHHSPPDGALPKTPASIEYGRDKSDGRHALLRLAVIVGAVVPLLFGASSILRYFNQNHHERSPRIECLRNMRQLGMAAIMEANNHNGRFADDIDSFAVAQELSGDTLICPTAEYGHQSERATPALFAALRQQKLISYIYVGKGLTTDAPNDTVLLYEPLANHADGMNVLFVDGDVKFLNSAQAKAILNQAAAGTWPIRYPVAGPTTMALPKEQ